MRTTVQPRHSALRTLAAIPPTRLRHRRVLVRIDINVETTGHGVRDTSRMEAIRPTVQYLLRHQAVVILVAHRGRPIGRDAKLSLRPLVSSLQSVLKHPITFLSQSVWDKKLDGALEKLKPGHIALLENIRFESGETSNDQKLARRLASFADLAVNDAFADSHRAHASIVGVSQFIPLVAGFGLAAELNNLNQALGKPKRPYVAVIGGAKISTKLGLVRKLLKQADAVLLGGALANTVLKAEGIAVGASLVEPDMIAAARGLHTTNAHLHIPVDVIVAQSVQAKPRTRAVGKVSPRERILDIGPDTIELFASIMKNAQTVVWNGPMGVYEHPPYNRGTTVLAKKIAALRAITVAGGGETLDAIKRQHLEHYFTVLSTGGGAMLEWLEGKTLPGVAACMKGKRL